MSYRRLPPLGASLIAVAVLFLAPVVVSGQTKTWTPPLTPYGQPDLQGVWVNNSSTPVERPKALEGRQLLTDAEVAQLKERADRLFNDGHSDFAAGDNFFLA